MIRDPPPDNRKTGRFHGTLRPLGGSGRTMRKTAAVREAIGGSPANTESRCSRSECELREPKDPREHGIESIETMKKITRRQFEIVGFIRDFIGKNGISPTLYDIAEHFAIKPSTAASHISALERKHVIERQKGRRRSIRFAGMGVGLPCKLPVCIPFFPKNASLSGAPASYYHVDSGLLPDNVSPKELFAVRVGVFGGLPSEHAVNPGDILIVRTKPDRLRPGMLVLEASEKSPVCRQVAADSEPGPDVLGQVVALMRRL